MLVPTGVNIGVYHLTIDRRRTEVRDLGEHESPLGLPDSMAEPGVFNSQKVTTEAVPQTNSSGLLRDAVNTHPKYRRRSNDLHAAENEVWCG